MTNNGVMNVLLRVGESLLHLTKVVVRRGRAYKQPDLETVCASVVAIAKDEVRPRPVITIYHRTVSSD